MGQCAEMGFGLWVRRVQRVFPILTINDYCALAEREQSSGESLARWAESAVARSPPQGVALGWENDALLGQNISNCWEQRHGGQARPLNAR